ncbi:MAG: nucleotidyltransferase domain-containing protein [Nanoarchaeota archaeon]
MDQKEIIAQIKQDFKGLSRNKNIVAILLYGSWACGEATPRSDIDLCIVAPKTEPQAVLSTVWRTVNVTARKYEVYVFEEMPLYLKMEVIDSHKVIYARDQGELYEYFYFFRKLWNDQKHRQEITKEEILGRG